MLTSRRGVIATSTGLLLGIGTAAIVALATGHIGLASVTPLAPAELAIRVGQTCPNGDTLAGQSYCFIAGSPGCAQKWSTCTSFCLVAVPPYMDCCTQFWTDTQCDAVSGVTYTYAGGVEAMKTADCFAEGGDTTTLWICDCNSNPLFPLNQPCVLDNPDTYDCTGSLNIKDTSFNCAGGGE